MKTVTIEELENTDLNEVYILDIRQSKDYEKGSVRGAKNIINIPFNELSADNELLPKDTPIYIICYKGESSGEACEMLEKAGFDAYSIEGGYREYWRNWLIKNADI